MPKAITATGVPSRAEAKITKKNIVAVVVMTTNLNKI
jgi:hypothetical protein